MLLINNILFNGLKQVNLLFINNIMISYLKIHALLRSKMTREGLSLRGLSELSGVDYGTLWRLLKARNHEEVFKDGKGRKGKLIMNLTVDTLDKLCKLLKKQPGDLLKYFK